MKTIKSLITGLLLAGAALAAQAGVVYTFSGSADSGSRVGQLYNGSLGFDEVAADFSGAVALTSFSMSAFGDVFELAGADAAAEALFDQGSFLGVYFLDLNPTFGTGLELSVDFAGLPALAYYDLGGALDGFGSLVFKLQANAVPLPGSLLLAATGLGLLTLRRRA
jgi:hypothetical protein